MHMRQNGGGSTDAVFSHSKFPQINAAIMWLNGVLTALRNDFLTKQLIYGGTLVVLLIFTAVRSSIRVVFLLAVSFFLRPLPAFSWSMMRCVLRYLDCLLFIMSFCSGLLRMSSSDSAIRAKSSKKACWCSAYQCLRVFHIGSVPDHTNRAFRGFSSYTDPQLSVFDHSFCANHARFIVPYLRLCSSGFSSAIFSWVP